MRLVRRFVGPAFWATVALVALLAIPKLSISRGLAIWVVLVAALCLMVLVRHSRAHAEPEPRRRFDEALRKPKPAAPGAAELLQMERELSLGSADADHAHRQLLPRLRAAASARLASRHGIELERRPEAARALLGEDAWELLRPDRPAPENRNDPGLPHEQIVALIEAVESL